MTFIGVTNDYGPSPQPKVGYLLEEWPEKNRQMSIKIAQK